MTELSERILKDFQIRKTKRQKDSFIRLIFDNFEDVSVETCGIFSSRNIIMGDVESAKYIFSAHYDTCAVLPFPNFITPKNLFFYLLYQVLICAPLLIVYPIIFSIVPIFEVAYLLGTVFLFAVMYFLLFGFANKHTANDNTSGVIELIELMSAMSESDKSKCAFVFFDNEELGLLGSLGFKRIHRKEIKSKLLINFDCISDGDYIMVMRNKKARSLFDNAALASFKNQKGKIFLFEKPTSALFPSDHSGFPMYFAVAAFRKNKILGYYISRIHTKKDTVFDETNIKVIKESIIEFVRNNEYKAPTYLA